MEFQVKVDEVLVNDNKYCVFLASDDKFSYKFTITRKLSSLIEKVSVGAKLSIKATLALRTRKTRNGNVVHENALYVEEM